MMGGEWRIGFLYGDQQAAREYLITLKPSSWKREKSEQPKAIDNEVTEIVKGQLHHLKNVVDKSQTKVPQMSKPSIILPSKKRKCMATKEEKASSEEVMAIMEIRLKRPEPIEVLMEICLDERRSERTFKVGSVLDPKIKDNLIKLLKAFEDVFAYVVEEMSGIDPEVAVHKLNIYPNQKPIRQKKRNLGPTRNQAIDQEV